MNGITDFLQYMFAPPHAPWYTGGFWGNQTQWTIVTLPALIFALWKLERAHAKRHREVVAHLKHAHDRIDQLERKL